MLGQQGERSVPHGNSRIQALPLSGIPNPENEVEGHVGHAYAPGRAFRLFLCSLSSDPHLLTQGGRKCGLVVG